MPTTMRFTALETYDADWLEITPLGDVEVVRGVAEIEEEELVQYLWRNGWNIVDGDVPADILEGFDGEFPYVSRWYDTDPERPVEDSAQPPVESDPAPARGRKSKK